MCGTSIARYCNRELDILYPNIFSFGLVAFLCHCKTSFEESIKIKTKVGQSNETSSNKLGQPKSFWRLCHSETLNHKSVYVAKRILDDFCINLEKKCSKPCFSCYLLKTTDFQLLQSILIVPSLLRQLSTSGKKIQKWCFGSEEEAEEVFLFCQTMLVHRNIINISLFSTQFFVREQTRQDVCTEPQQFKKSLIFTFVWWLPLPS